VGIPTASVPLAKIRAGEIAFPSARRAVLSPAAPKAMVCDAETDSDLDLIAGACLDSRPVLVVGSAGLAHALARRISPTFGQRAEPIHVSPSRHGALIVAGSQARATRAALRELESLSDIERLTLSVVMEPLDNAALIDRLARGKDLVVDLAAPDAGRYATPEQAQQLARRLAHHVVPFAAHASALVATGGETAAALFERCGVTGIQLIDEIEHGITLGLTLGSLSVPVVTKAGGFGDAGCLRRIIERLRFIRGSGTVA
jgi:D-threonate/D-erythronate kinase